MNLDRLTSTFDFDARLVVAPAIPGKPVTLSGYAMIWGETSSDRGNYRVRLAPNSALPAAEVHALSSHNYERLIGTTYNGSLRIQPDAIGVKVEIDLPDTSDGRDVAELVRRRDLRGMSFGIANEPTFVETTENGLRIRDYQSFIYDEVTVTPIPAFSQTVIGIKDADAAPPLIGYSRRTADALTLEKFRFESLRLHEAEHLVPVR